MPSLGSFGSTSLTRQPQIAPVDQAPPPTSPSSPGSKMASAPAAANTHLPPLENKDHKGHMVVDTKTGHVTQHIDVDGDGTDDWSVPPAVKGHPYFVEVQDGSIIEALKTLNEKLKAKGMKHIISCKPVRNLFGQCVEAGQVGLYEYNGRPVLAINPGRYWNMSIYHEWRGSHSITDQLEFLGLTMAQVGQGECLVVQAPNNNVFCIRNGGFVAFGSEGRFKILAVIDTLNLGDDAAIREQSTNIVLGWKKEVKSNCQTATGQWVPVTVATFFNVPANNVLVVQQNDRLLQLPAGQHVVTNPNTTYRGFFSLAERQKTFKTKPSYTVEGVPVVLNVNLRYRLAEPLLLARHYSEPFAALENPAQAAVNSVVSRLSYSQFMRAKNLAGDIPDVEHVGWLEQFKQECMAELSKQAQCYGVVVESFTVLDRSLEGELGLDLQRQADSVLQNQIRSTQIALENSIKITAEKGKLAVAEVEAQQKRTRTDADYYENVKKAQAETEASAMRAKQEAENIRLLADAKAKEIQLLSGAYKDIKDPAALEIMLAELEVKKTKALPAQTVYFSGSGRSRDGSNIEQSYVQGYGTALGVGLAAKGHAV